MSAMAEASAAIHAHALADLPTQQVLGIYKYALRMWVGMPVSNPEEPYYFRMMNLAQGELRARANDAARKLEQLQ